MPLLHRFSQFLRTLRVRLTIWNTTVVLIAVLVALLAVREGLRFYLIQETDTVLDAEARELVLTIEQLYPNRALIEAEMERKAESHRRAGWSIRWVDPQRQTVLWEGPHENTPPQLLRQLTDFRDGALVWVSETHRSIERRVHSPNIPEYYVRVGTQTAFIDADVTRVTRILAPIGLAILLLAPLGGFLLAERAIAPIQDMIVATEQFSPQRLEKRLTLRGVGDEPDQLAAKINTFLEQIADHLRRNRDFVANAAHELRSPLAAILSSVEVTLERPRSADEYTELLYAIDDECRHLTTLVNQLLQLAESEGPPSAVPAEPVAMDELVRRGLEMFTPVAEDRGVRLRAELPERAVVLGDRQQLRQVVTNLIDNAIKFTPADGTISIAVSHDRPSAQVLLMVSDSGIGIPQQDLPRIFDRFYQVDKARNRSGDQRGNGLGLSICAAIVQRHQGNIQVASTLGQGTTFTLRFPAAAEPMPAGEAPL